MKTKPSLSTKTTNTIKASDGLLYDDFTAYLLGEPQENTRNGNIKSYRRHGYTEKAVRAYAEAFDKVAFPCPGPSKEFGKAHQAGIEAAILTGGFCSPASRASNACAEKIAAAFAERLDATVFRILASQRPSTSGAGQPAAVQAQADPVHPAP